MGDLRSMIPPILSIRTCNERTWKSRSQHYGSFKTMFGSTWNDYGKSGKAWVIFERSVMRSGRW